MSNNTKERIDEMLRVNEGQKKYYEVANGVYGSKENSFATNLWRNFRRRMLGTIESVDIVPALNQRQRDWVGDISDKKVLDLGVGGGNPLSLEFARNAREYVAIDLSQARVKSFSEKLAIEGIVGAKAVAVDFLSDSFEEVDFDVVYAMSVMHHFKHVDAFLQVLHRRTAPGAIVLTLDPLQTWLPARLIRAMYRPFQTDKAWEFPFSRETLQTIRKYFEIKHVQGLYSLSKWAAPLSLLSKDLGLRKVQEWHQRDWEHARTLDASQACLRVAFALERKDRVDA